MVTSKSTETNSRQLISVAFVCDHHSIIRNYPVASFFQGIREPIVAHGG